MRAAVAAGYGPPEVVRVTEVADPVPGDDELLVRVCATTVNRTDCGYRAAEPFFIRLFSGLTKPKRPVLGTEFAGIVEAVGSAVTNFDAGDRVFGWCEGSFGAHAELLTVSASSPVATIPSGLTFEQVAPATEGWHYAQADIRAAGIEPGQDVLVYGATGAIGSAAVQILVSLGATVTAVCATEQVPLVESLGPQRVIDRTVEDFTKSADTYDVVFDAVGKSTFGRCRRVLRPKGIYITTDLGPWWQNVILPLLTRVFRGRRVMIKPPKDDPGMAREVAAMMARGEFHPVVDRVFPLDQIVEAYEYVETGQKIGNVVIAVQDCDVDRLADG